MRDLYTRNTDRGRGGSKIPKIRLTSFVHGPHLNKLILKRPFGFLPVVAGVVNREAEERPEDLGEHGEDGRDDVGDGELQHEVVHPRHLVRR